MAALRRCHGRWALVRLGPRQTTAMIIGSYTRACYFGCLQGLEGLLYRGYKYIYMYIYVDTDVDVDVLG